ncbi:hypothetical protein TcWFU_009127 [Taenia crassiceps]|uniref:Uncharacterized protein n=1 Tax=Taenia crassiceps TaxID=6207 RepID=A0ABR4QES0_9CEST
MAKLQLPLQPYPNECCIFGHALTKEVGGESCLKLPKERLHLIRRRFQRCEQKLCCSRCQLSQEAYFTCHCLKPIPTKTDSRPKRVWVSANSIRDNLVATFTNCLRFATAIKGLVP